MERQPTSRILQQDLTAFRPFFQRKYPDLTRRTIDAWERQYLTQKGIITALGAGQADLGLTALRSDEVMVILEKDYPDTYAAVSQILQQRRIQSIRDKQKAQYQVSTLVVLLSCCLRIGVFMF